jgi:hypothetical protein
VVNIFFWKDPSFRTYETANKNKEPCNYVANCFVRQEWKIVHYILIPKALFAVHHRGIVAKLIALQIHRKETEIIGLVCH